MQNSVKVIIYATRHCIIAGNSIPNMLFWHAIFFVLILRQLLIFHSAKVYHYNVMVAF